MTIRRSFGVALMAAALAVGGGPIAAASAKPSGKHHRSHRARAAQSDQSTTTTGTGTSTADPGATPVTGSASDHCPNM